MIQFTTRNRFRIAILGCAGFLLLATFLLYGDATEGNWRADDPQILVHTVKYPLIQSFTSPVVWQELSPANLTPWVVASFRIDLSLFGLEPGVFYIHQLLALWLAAVAGLLLLSLWCNLSFAVAGALLFLCGTPLIAVSNNLMTRHYIEGLVFAAFSLYFAVLFLRSAKLRYLFYACGLYALAITAKEIYVPLVLFLPTIREGKLNTRIRICCAFIVLATSYALWRAYMLQNLIGGYVDPQQLITLAYFSEALQGFARIPAMLLGDYWAIPSLAFIVLLAINIWYERWSSAATLALVGLVLAPLIPLSGTPEIFYPGRYYLLVWFTFAFSLPYLLQTLSSRIPNSINPNSKHIAFSLATLLLAATVLISQQPIRENTVASNKAFDAQASFLWANSDTDYFVPSDHVLNAYWFYRGMRDLKVLTNTNTSSPVSVPDASLLTQQSQPLFKYDPQCQCMEDISNSLPELLTDHANRVDPNGELEVNFSFSNNTFRWNFGPYQDANYFAISDFLGAIRLPPSGEVKLYYVATTLPLVIGYFSEDGRKIYSEELVVSHNAPEVQWSRK